MSDASAAANRRELTIRPATADERRIKFPPIVPGGSRVRVPKYVVVSAASGGIVSVFGIPQGGDTRSEAVFWAKRAASKNDYDYISPAGWERVEGRLPHADS